MDIHRVAHYAIGLLALGLATFSAYHVGDNGKRLARVESQPVAVTGQASGPWGLLRQAEVDALTKKLAGLEKRPVVIFCTLDCSGMALDFDNAFESAKWASDIERPAIDTNVGINVAPDDAYGKAMAALINDATGGRFNVGTIPGSLDGNKAAVVISKKIKSR